MPLALKDLYRAEISLASIRRHVRHPIDNIVVVGQDKAEIRAFCSEHSMTYINENDVLPLAMIDYNYRTYGQSKPTTFVLQQLIKLSAFDFMDADNVLVHDADTYFMRDVAFFVGDRQILFVSDEYTKSYERLLLEFIGPIKRYHRSFVAHSMIFQRRLVERLNHKVRNIRGRNVIDAILENIEIADRGGLSEYELYGNFLNSFHSEDFVTRYWYNRKIPPDTMLPLAQLEELFWNMNSVSAHEH